MEVNSSPGLQGIESATNLDVAGAIIDYIANQTGLPEIDVRQRLTVSTGYGVAELVVHPGADLVGQTLGESGLRDRDISVLTLHRGTTVMPPAQQPQARGRRPPALLRAARGDARPHPAAQEAPDAGPQAAQGADPRFLTGVVPECRDCSQHLLPQPPALFPDAAFVPGEKAQPCGVRLRSRCAGPRPEPPARLAAPALARSPARGPDRLRRSRPA